MRVGQKNKLASHRLLRRVHEVDDCAGNLMKAHKDKNAADAIKPARERDKRLGLKSDPAGVGVRGGWLCGPSAGCGQPTRPGSRVNVKIRL
jgi:hypothetical protein